MSSPVLTLKYFVVKARGEVPRLILRGAGSKSQYDIKILYNLLSSIQ